MFLIDNDTECDIAFSTTNLAVIIKEKTIHY